MPLATHIASPLLAEDRAVWRSVKALLHDVPELVPVAVCCTNHVVCAGSWLIMNEKSKIVSIFFMGWIYITNVMPLNEFIIKIVNFNTL